MSKRTLSLEVFCLSPEEVLRNVEEYSNRMFCKTEEEFKVDFEEKWDPKKYKLTISIEEA